MKVIACLVAAIAAHKITHKASGIDGKALMQEQPSHWRKTWPQGAVDNSEGDSEVLDMFLKPEHVKVKKPITYPWSLDEDAVSTAHSLTQAEKMTGKKLSTEGVRNGGMGMIFTYDNTKTVFERDTPQGNKWHNFEGQHN